MGSIPSALCGEVDLATAGAFRADLYTSVDRCDTPLVVIDLGDVTFIDSAGFHALVDATEYALGRGHVMVIRNVSSFYVEMLRICDWDNELRFVA